MNLMKPRQKAATNAYRARTGTRKGSLAAFALAMLLLLSLLTGCAQPQPENGPDAEGLYLYEHSFFAMDTYIGYRVWGTSEEEAKAFGSKVEEAFQRIEGITNRFDASSELSRLNASAADLTPSSAVQPQGMQVSAELLEMLELAIDWNDRTGGALNVFLGGLSDLWNIGGEKPAVPSQAAIAAQLQTVAKGRIALQADRVILSPAGIVLDLGAVAKGYGADTAARALREAGCKRALIDAGGTVVAIGTKTGGQPWSIGLQDPKDLNKLAGVVKVADKALVTSGDYQRYFEQGSVRYHHILDPSTGFPAQGLHAVTVLTDSAALGDILSTALFVLGPEKGYELACQLSEQGSAEVLFTLNDYTQKATPGWPKSK